MFAEFETNLRKERQLEGLAKAKAEGVYKGRKPFIDMAPVRALQSEGFGATAIAERLGIGRASVYRVLAQARHRELEATSVETDLLKTLTVS